MAEYLALGGGGRVLFTKKDPPRSRIPRMRSRRRRGTWKEEEEPVSAGDELDTEPELMRRPRRSATCPVTLPLVYGNQRTAFDKCGLFVKFIGNTISVS